MAKRSDFTQKLLDDLRLRKERLASSTRTSNRSDSYTAIIDAYSYARKNFRGSKDIRTNDHMIVPCNNRRSQISSQHQKMGDLTKALAFALENGGKINITDSSSSSSRISMLSFLHRISKTKTRSNNASNRLVFSLTQIEEISKGVCRINQILRACSNSGAKFDQKSIQIGKELLKGATDLESSLKLLLLGFGEDSDYAVKPQRKNRIRLLDDSEDKDDDEISSNITKDWQLDVRRSRLVAHSRSASSLSETKVQPSCSSKARIPNVIAKLMGLENLPEEEIVPTPSPEPREISKMAKRERLLFNKFGLVIKDDEKPKMAVVKKERNHDEIVKKKQSLNSQNKRSQLQNVDVEIQKPVKAKNSSEVVKKQKASEMGLKSSTSSKSNLEKLSKKSLRKDNNATRSQVHSTVKERHNSTELKSDKETRRQRSPQVMQVVDETVVRVTKEKVTKVQRKDDLARRDVKQVKPTRLEKPKSDAVIKSNISEANDHQMIVKEAEQTLDQCDLREHEVTSLKEPDILGTSDDFCQSVTTNDHLINQATLCEDREINGCIDVANELDDAITTDKLKTEPEAIDKKTTSQITQEETTKQLAKSIILTKSENRVKQILIKSQLFVNTSEALFKLDIPIATLHNSSTGEEDRYNNNEQSKLILDCGYELMRRKARRQELAVLLANAKVSTTITSFDSLVRELNNDFEKLRTYGISSSTSSSNNNNNKDDYYNWETYYCYSLSGMQENDVLGKGPDVNCMWDLGWNDTAFAVFEVVRDVEKFVLNGLLDDIARDVFLHFDFVS